MLTCLCDLYPLTPHFYIVNINCRYSLEPPHWGGSYVYPQSMFRAKIIRNLFLSKNFHFYCREKSLYIVWTCFRYESAILVHKISRALNLLIKHDNSLFLDWTVDALITQRFVPLNPEKSLNLFSCYLTKFKMCDKNFKFDEFVNSSRWKAWCIPKYHRTAYQNHLSLVVRKPAFCICENKDADQLRGNREADQRLCFRYIDSTILPLHISEISSH